MQAARRAQGRGAARAPLTRTECIAGRSTSSRPWSSKGGAHAGDPGRDGKAAALRPHAHARSASAGAGAAAAMGRSAAAARGSHSGGSAAAARPLGWPGAPPRRGEEAHLPARGARRARFRARFRRRPSSLSRRTLSRTRSRAGRRGESPRRGNVRKVLRASGWPVRHHPHDEELAQGNTRTCSRLLLKLWRAAANTDTAMRDGAAARAERVRVSLPYILGDL